MEDEAAADEVKRVRKAYKEAIKEAKAYAEDESIKIEERIASLYSRLEQSLVDGKRFEKETTVNRNKADILKKDIEDTLSKLSAAKNLSARLLQQNKLLEAEKTAMLEENKMISESEQNARQQLTEKFHSTISEVKEQMEKQKAETERIQQDNEELKAKFADFAKQFKESEKDQKEKLISKGHTFETMEKRMKESARDVESLTLQQQQLQSAEATLKAQLKEYGDRFATLKDNFMQSNEEFDAIKTANEDMKAREAQTSKALIQLDSDKSKANNQKDALEKLCKTLNAQLNVVKGKIGSLEQELGAAATGDSVSSGVPAEVS
mmetsp:Transcript_51983/g.114007  ORF Transcript_51983/g.114007 Transcript_51983/m.114007 type:complete len:322 (+) Transcript_51983:53-1018(+)